MQVKSLVSGLCACTVLSLTAQTVEHPLKLGPDVTPPAVLKQVDPNLTRSMRKRITQTQVTVHLVIDEKGLPQNLHVDPQPGADASQQEFDESAMQAVKKWRFRPATFQGTPVAVELNVQVNFQIIKKP